MSEILLIVELMELDVRRVAELHEEVIIELILLVEENQIKEPYGLVHIIAFDKVKAFGSS